MAALHSCTLLPWFFPILLRELFFNPSSKPSSRQSVRPCRLLSMATKSDTSYGPEKSLETWQAWRGKQNTLHLIYQEVVKRWGRLKMAAYTLGIAAAPRETKQRSAKSLQTTCTVYSRRQKKVNVPFPFRFRSVGVPLLSTVLKRCYNGNLRTVQRSFRFRSVPFRFNIFVLTQYAVD